MDHHFKMCTIRKERRRRKTMKLLWMKLCTFLVILYFPICLIFNLILKDFCSPSTSLLGWCFLTSTVVDQGLAGCITSHLLLTSLIRCLSTHTWSVLRGRALQCLSDLSCACEDSLLFVLLCSYYVFWSRLIIFLTECPMFPLLRILPMVHCFLKCPRCYEIDFVAFKLRMSWFDV